MGLQNEVEIWTDGACEPNPGAGGWAAILLFENTNGKAHQKEISGGDLETTNNRMEIMGVLQGLKALKRKVHIKIFSDSKYVVNAIGRWIDGKPANPKGWIVNWKERGWKRKEGSLKNKDLWIEIWEAVSSQKSVSMSWVRGHAGQELNERCDYLAVVAREALFN